MSFAPCKDCTKRELGCHDRCDDYKLFKAELERVRKNRDDELRFRKNPRIEKLVRDKRRRDSCR